MSLEFSLAAAVAASEPKRKATETARGEVEGKDSEATLPECESWLSHTPAR